MYHNQRVMVRPGCALLYGTRRPFTDNFAVSQTLRHF